MYDNRLAVNKREGVVRECDEWEEVKINFHII